MNKTFTLVLAVVASAFLAGCGGSDDTPAQVAAADASLAASPTTTAAVANTPFAFPSGVTSFGTTATTTVAFTNTATTPAFSIASGANTATGTTTFGSCIFAVTSSTFPAGSPLAVGQTVTVNPCNINVNSKGLPGNGQGATRSVALLLGAAVSAGVPVTVSVNAGGQLTLNGQSVGTVTLVPVTGATGGTS